MLKAPSRLSFQQHVSYVTETEKYEYDIFVAVFHGLDFTLYLKSAITVLSFILFM